MNLVHALSDEGRRQVGVLLTALSAGLAGRRANGCTLVTRVVDGRVQGAMVTCAALFRTASYRGGFSTGPMESGSCGHGRGCWNTSSAGADAPVLSGSKRAAERLFHGLFFEPTDMRFAAKPFNASILAAKAIRFISPNLYELRKIARNLRYEGSVAATQVEDIKLTELLREVRLLGGFVNRHVDNVIVTLGAYGVVVIRRTSEHVPFFSADTGYYKSPGSGSGAQCRFYRGRVLDRIVNVSGAGDSFTSGFVAAMLDGQLESPLLLGKNRLEKSLGLSKVNELMKKAIPKLMKNIQKGEEFVMNKKN
ncbi:conserved hypothetical protein [Culex quinquefasciatus]|uniref:Carbohydrate kinase PfkB domain-containing protein n=1 Tax=Culex quinquefasciatus TaxID=7176 RepID=B0WVP7_CULQU|nr:conserved hypothetical protein [Culex quinquefasciatus]|eukprot:XP_001861469.1 conserved hypothetical protein [Culex quinquefasciatus]